MNDVTHTLNRDHARAILNKCAASIARIAGRKATRAAAGSPLPPTSAAACFFPFPHSIGPTSEMVQDHA